MLAVVLAFLVKTWLNGLEVILWSKDLMFLPLFPGKPGSSTDPLKTWEIIVIAVGSVLLVLLIVGVVCCCKKTRGYEPV